MLTAALKHTWRELISPYCTDEQLTAREINALIAHYSAAGRFYHGLHHLQALFALQQQYGHTTRNNEIVQLAIFYHDIVYDVMRTDNEEASALAAGRFLQQTAFPPYQIIMVMDYIRATKVHTGDEHDDDLHLFLDFDLAILGSPADLYQEYAQQIRLEYAVYPDEVYKPGRKKVLMHFLEKPFIYSTMAFREEYEAQARKNIGAELELM